jgi:dihydroflavonol-4-reductase
VVAVTLVTGATGLVGSHVARLLVERGDEVRVTTRADSAPDNLEGLAVAPVVCDLLDRRAVRRAMRGVTRLFHVAGSTSLRGSRAALMRDNVDTTRMVLSEALRAGVERVVHTSSVAAVGPAAPGSTADERQAWNAGRLGIPFLDAKRESELEAVRHAAQGLPVVVVCPATVFGPGDVNRSSTELVRRFLTRAIPFYVDGGVNVVDVEDVARGHLLAEERGTVGERYVLGNRNFTIDRLLADLGRLSGVEPPAVKLPVVATLALARAAEAVSSRPALTQTEVRLASMWWTVRSTKARRELGWRPSHHEDTLESTIAWYREREGDGLAPAGSRQPLALRLAGTAERRALGVVRALGMVER